MIILNFKLNKLFILEKLWKRKNYNHFISHYLSSREWLKLNKEYRVI